MEKIVNALPSSRFLRLVMMLAALIGCGVTLYLLSILIPMTLGLWFATIVTFPNQSATIVAVILMVVLCSICLSLFLKKRKRA